MSTEVTINGLKELSDALKMLPEKIRGKVLGAAVKAGADLVRDTAKENARAIFKDPTGATEQSIVAYRQRKSTPDSITYAVGVTMKKRWPLGRRRASSGVMGRTGKTATKQGSWPAFWWRFSEFGTTKESKRPWLVPAWTSSSGFALAMIKRMLEAGISIAVASLPKYTGRG